MTENLQPRPVTLSIAAVERDTGLSKDTLRVWERRYGFPVPIRDAQGERTYPFPQVERLRVIRRLLDAGHRPGRIVALPPDDLERLADTLGAPASTGPATPPTTGPIDHEVRVLAEALQANDVARLRRQLASALARRGLGRFVVELAAPLNKAVGDAWMQGRLEVYQEHLYTEAMQVVLRNALHLAAVADEAAPLVLLATVSGEPHGLGLLMAEAMLVLEGCRCISLGVQTPVWDIVRAAEALGAQVVAVGYTGCTPPSALVEGLTEMRRKLPSNVALWAGGSAPVLQRRPIEGVHVIPVLERLPAAVAEWRAARQQAH